MTEKKCDHKWVHLSTHYRKKEDRYAARFIRMDIFFCEKCCEKKEVVKEEYAMLAPVWWRH